MSFEVIQGECLIEMPKLIARGVRVGACIADPPYGTTACAWDAVIPFAPMWANLKGLVKRDGAIVLFGSQPFTSALVMSNPQMFKHELLWLKEQGNEPQLCNVRPMKAHENLLVFCAGSPVYNPQFSEGTPYSKRQPLDVIKAQHLGRTAFTGLAKAAETRRYPLSYRFFNCERQGMHPTQKPVELLRYLVRTYTNPGDTVLDFTAGSFSTGVACIIEGRNFIGIEQSEEYCGIGEARMRRASGEACDIPRIVKSEKVLPLFAGAVA